MLTKLMYRNMNIATYGMLDKDFEEEFLLNYQMEELMLDDEMSAELNDSCPEDMVELVPVESTEEIVYVPDSNSKERKQKHLVESLIFFHKNNTI